MPVVLRPLGDGKYWLLGDSYVHGFMEGETMEGLEEGEYEIQDIEILVGIIIF